MTTGRRRLLYGAGNEDIVRHFALRMRKPEHRLEAGAYAADVGGGASGFAPDCRPPVGRGRRHPRERKGARSMLRSRQSTGRSKDARAGAGPRGSPQQAKGLVASPLAMAAYFGDEAALLSLDHGADINFDADFAGHALNWALYSGHTALAAELVAKGANLHFKSPWGHGTAPMVFAGYSEQGDPANRPPAHGAGLKRERGERGGRHGAYVCAEIGAPHASSSRFLESAGAKTTPAAPPARPRSAGSCPTPSLFGNGPEGDRPPAEGSTNFVNNRFVRDEAKCVSCHHEYCRRWRSPGAPSGAAGRRNGPGAPAGRAAADVASLWSPRVRWRIPYPTRQCSWGTPDGAAPPWGTRPTR